MTKEKSTIPIEVEIMTTTLRKKIIENGFRQEDKRLKRTTMSLPGDFVVVSNVGLLNWMKGEKQLDKYVDDWKRMYTSFNRMVKETKEDKNSRRLMVFNDSRYQNIYQCFTHFQFVYTGRNEFDMYVYQRSADIAKLKDDMIFFANIMKKFEQKTKEKCTKLVVIYGNVHEEIKTKGN